MASAFIFVACITWRLSILCYLHVVSLSLCALALWSLFRQLLNSVEIRLKRTEKKTFLALFCEILNEEIKKMINIPLHFLLLLPMHTQGTVKRSLEWEQRKEIDNNNCYVWEHFMLPLSLFFIFGQEQRQTSRKSCLSEIWKREERITEGRSFRWNSYLVSVY
jgi:hypothetical protein